MSVERQAGLPQSLLLLLGSCLPVLGAVLLAPVLPLMQQHFADTPGVAVLVPIALTLPDALTTQRERYEPVAIVSSYSPRPRARWPIGTLEPAGWFWKSSARREQASWAASGTPRTHRLLE